MFELLIPYLVFLVPVLVVVAFAVLTGRRLKGSCGGVTPAGNCSVCGKPAAEMPSGQQKGGGGPCS